MQFAMRFLVAAVGVCTLNMAGCSSAEPKQSDPGETAAQTGTLALPLVTTAGGHTYKLAAQFYIYGPLYNWYYSNDNSEQMNISLPTGDYSLYLYSWQLYRVGKDGVQSPVVANLLSNFHNFTIYNHSTSSVSFQFETDGLIVTTGMGSLDVDVEVTEVAPNCTPLGNDCGEGYWCPPGELTSRTPSCVAAGRGALGEACRNPADCVANATCIDLGSGPICVGLCGSSEFDDECDSGGLCTPQALDYGICVDEDNADAGVEADAGSDASADADPPQ